MFRPLPRGGRGGGGKCSNLCPGEGGRCSYLCLGGVGVDVQTSAQGGGGGRCSDLCPGGRGWMTIGVDYHLLPPPRC